MKLKNSLVQLEVNYEVQLDFFFEVKDENGNPEEGMGNSGILFNHAYGI